MLPIRNVARVIVIDACGAVLLCRYSEADRAYWVPPGGALELGEDHHAAAMRELREETGLAASLEAELWERRFVLHLKDGPVDQIERYFLVRLSLEQPFVSNTSTEDIQELRWWQLRELQSTADRIYPDGLAERLLVLLSGVIPQRAI
jgi:8-oxo-dGTP pyrophosphatase MutT (NUDIX family)